jgi:hypothetical protein
MYISARQAVTAFLAAFCFSLWLAAEVGSAPAPELQKLHALLVVDTQANLGESVLVDGDRMKQLLQTGIPKERLYVTVLAGKDVTASKIVAYYRNLKVSQSDVLLFYYTGHGATHTEKGHFLAFQDGKIPGLLRADLRTIMQEKQAGLTVLLTDCCSTRIKVEGKTNDRKLAGAPPAAKELNPLFRNLLFQHRGVVDITAASGNFAFADNRDGGLFTRALGNVLLPKQSLPYDGNKDGFVSWKEFFPSLRQETENISAQWIKDFRQQPQKTELKIDQKTQRPQAFELTEATTAPPSLTIRNVSTGPLRYQFRWGGEGAFESAVLKTQEARTHTLPAGKSVKDNPNLEVKTDSGNSVQLKAGKTYRYSGSATKNRSLLDDEDDIPTKP